MKRKVVVNLEPEGYSDKAKMLLSEHFDYIECSEINDNKDILKKANGIISRLNHQLDEEFLKNSNALEFLATATTGTNHIDTDFTNANQIQVISLKGEVEFLKRITPTAEHTWGLLISLLRNYKFHLRNVESRNWDRDSQYGTQLLGKTIGIIGLGRLGLMVADYAKCFGMNVIYNDIESRDHWAKSVSLDVLMRTSDIISVHVPLNTDTEKMLSIDEFDVMKDGVFLVNTARGEIIDESALMESLKSGKVAGAALDVLSGEKKWRGVVPSDNHLVEWAIQNTNLIVTPHIGGACPDAMRMTEEFVASKIIQHYTKI
ncbi:D-isomer specific 2-hydroxyacid dehydrogenase family protein [Enterovibrio makurazakiensis]|uniref:2-hydroxyacid dehydrogenase n=1 Tax=Enterovibrio makurazakiensis TaxID=2910232 RepID=UPI003D243D2D